MQLYIPQNIFVQITIPLLIFLARAADVSMAAMRIIFVTRGIRALAAMIGFFEMLIWLIGITQIMQNLNNPVNYLAFAAGFSMGTFVGITIERKIAIGNLAIQLITGKDTSGLLTYFRANGYGATAIDAQGTSGPVKIIYIIVRRKLVDKALDIITKFDPDAFYIMGDVQVAARLGPAI
ncbi:MAG TPA: DUF5698 domain-containing protein [Candidatus Omnitrophota bacterium]|nr:DUF5698 domain-containing protein [Candidatus Omnitrophota bacterium]HRZ14716.1 DUF5698 domain-containing protein [Candidatus Omnitrophota bacterium]